MNQFFSHVIVSLLMVSLLLSACAPARNLAIVIERDASLTRYNELSATAHEELSPDKLAERDSLWRARQLSAWALAQEEGFDFGLLVQRDSLVNLQHRQNVLVSSPDSILNSDEIAEREMLVQSESARAMLLTEVGRDLRGSKLSTIGIVGVVLGTAVVAAGVVFLIALREIGETLNDVSN